MPWLKQTISVFLKDLKGEFRQKYALTTILLFAFVVVMAVSFAMGGIAPGARYGGILFWITVLFADLAGFSHIFVQEEEQGTALALKLSGKPASIFWGKLLFNLFLGILLIVVLIPLSFIFLGLETTEVAAFVVIALGGNIALVAGTTLIAAITAKTGSKGALFTILSFPILLPVLVILIKSTQSILSGEGLEVQKNELLTLVSYIMLMLTSGHFLFEFVWKEN